MDVYPHPNQDSSLWFMSSKTVYALDHSASEIVHLKYPRFSHKG